MEVQEAVWAKRWQRDAADSIALGAQLVAWRAQAIAEDVPLLEPVTVHKLDQTLRRIPDNTGLGNDCVQPGAPSTHLSRPNWNFAAFLTAS